MGTIFISHSAKDKRLAELWSEFLQIGMGVPREEIFCSSLNRAIPTGEDFIRTIKEQMDGCRMVVALITEEYLNSKFCIMELGAAWILSPNFCPLLGGNVDYSHLENTPLKSIQMRKILSEEDICAIYSEMNENKIIPRLNIWEFQRRLPMFMEKVRKNFGEEEYIAPDSEGYYRLIIEKERNVPREYRCYKVKGKLLIEGVDAEDETHWIFFKKGVYDDLKKGMCVQIKVGKTERRKFPDIGWARNIYPDELYVVCE